MRDMILSLLKKLTVQFEPGERESGEREREREGEREKGKERARERGRRIQVLFHIPHTFTGDYQCPPIQQQ